MGDLTLQDGLNAFLSAAKMAFDVNRKLNYKGVYACKNCGCNSYTTIPEERKHSMEECPECGFPRRYYSKEELENR